MIADSFDEYIKRITKYRSYEAQNFIFCGDKLSLGEQRV